MLVVGMALALWQHDAVFAEGGRLRGLFVVGAAALVVAGLGLLPVPAFVLAVVQPGTAAAAAGHAHTLTWSVPDTVDALAMIGLAGGTAIVAGVWAATLPSRRVLEVAAVVGTGLVVSTAVLHACFGLTSLFGVAETWVTPPKRFFAPFLNNNHTASWLLLTWPLWVDRLLDAERERSHRWLAAIALVVSGGLLVATGSRGALLAALAVAALVAMSRGRLPHGLGIGIGAVVVGLLVVVGPMAAPGRAGLWSAALRAWVDHPIFGSGAGTFGRVVDAYRSDTDFASWHHAHSEPLQWLVETGLVGIVAVGLGVVWTLRSRPRHVGSSRWLMLGVLGVGLHGLVEFPLHVPGILLCAASLYAIALIGTRSTTEGDPGRIRRWLAAALVLQVGFGAWMVRTALEERAVHAVLARGTPTAVQAARRLAWVAPWRAEIALHRGWSLSAAGRVVEAAELARNLVNEHPENPDVLRHAADLLARGGALDEARAAVERAVARDPSDWRPWLVRAGVVERQDPESSVDAWMQAIRRGADPAFLLRVWERLPVGLAWVEAVAERPASSSRALARVLASLDPEAAIVAHEQARIRDGRADVRHLRLLVELDRLGEADLLLPEARAERPHDRRLVRLEAELRGRQGRHEEAAELWLGLADEEPRAHPHALRATRRARGVEAALALAEVLLLEHGVSRLHPDARLEHARLLLEAGRPQACKTRLRRSGLLADDRHASAARAVLGRCRAASETDRPKFDGIRTDDGDAGASQ